jgi:hypothetical protein
MSALHTVALPIFTMLGLAGCGTGAIVLLAAGMSDSASAADKSSREGCGFGVAGLVLLAIAAGMTFL